MHGIYEPIRDYKLKNSNKKIFDTIGGGNCPVCNKTWEDATQKHCAKCHEIYYPVKQSHCYNEKNGQGCCATWISDTHGHCFKCHKTNNRSIEYHCRDCHGIFNKNKLHCCLKSKTSRNPCGKDYDPENEFHCDKCHKNFPKSDKNLKSNVDKIAHENKLHCLVCGEEVMDGTKHCLVCCLVYKENEEHCCRCPEKAKWDPKIMKHCKTCHKTIPIETIHCPNCCMNLKDGEEHCCKCPKNSPPWDPKIMKHCNLCHITLPNNFEHCCGCPKNSQGWDHQKENHCSKCHQTYDKNLKHCSDCCITTTKDELHCCRCPNKLVWNPENSRHCKQLNCHKNWNFREFYHCGNCHQNYKNGNGHCCGCKKYFEDNLIHCGICCTDMKQSDEHCCGCRGDKLWDFKTEYHCNKCHKNYPQNNTHCCDCKQFWDKEKQIHCSRCHTVTLKNQKHCCICRKVWNDGEKEECNCSKIKILLTEIIYDFMNRPENLNLRSKLIISPCLECKPMQMFINGLRELGITDIFEFLKNNKNYIIVWHGTQILDAAKNIMCEGFMGEGNRRRGVYGEGDYFALKFSISEDYAKQTHMGIRGNGYVLLNLVVEPNIINSKKPNKSKFVTADQRSSMHVGETYLIVNNPSRTEKNSYTLPLGVIPLAGDEQNFISCPKNPKINSSSKLSTGVPVATTSVLKQQIEKIISAIRDDKIGFEDSSSPTGVSKYQKESIRIMMENINKQNYIYTYFINNFDYEINLLDMAQKNIKTGKIRKIVILP